MRTIIKWSFILLCFWAFNIQAQSIQVRVPDTTGVRGSTIDIPIYVDSSVTGKNILSFQFKINYNAASITPTAIVNTGTLSSSFSSPIFTTNTSNNTITISSAGSTPLAGKGALLYIRFSIIQATIVTLSFTNTNDCYFNQGLPVMSFKSGNLTIGAPPTITAYFSSLAPLTVGDSIQVNVSGGISPYSYQPTNPSIATITSTGMLKSIGIGKTKVRTQSANLLVDTTDDEIEIRALKLSLPDTTILPLASIIYPIKINSTTSSSIFSGSFRINYYQGYLLVDSIITTGTLLQNATVQFQNYPGYTIVSFATSIALTGAGDLIKLRFKVINPSSSNLNLQDILFNQNIQANKKDGYIYYTALSALYLSPSYGEWFVNETQQFTATGGKSPYLFSVTDTSVASISPAGLFKAKNGGLVKVQLRDSLNTLTQSSNLQIYDAAFSIPSISMLAGSSLNIPIFISNSSGNKAIKSFQLTINFGTNTLDSVDVITANTLSAGWTVVKNVSANKIILAFAGTNQIVTNGILFRLKAKVITTSSFSLNTTNLLFNEGNFYSKITDGYISIVSNIQYNIGINSINGINSSCTKSSQETVAATIYNYGNQTLFIGDTVFVGYRLNANPILKDTVILSTNLNQGASFNFSFKVKVNLALPNAYNIKVFTAQNGDIDRNNDSLSTTTNVYGNPTVNLGNDTFFCDSSFILLNAGNNGASYLWSTNATTQTIIADSTNKYWVKVTSPYNCIATDTIQLTKIPKPTKAGLSAVATSSVCGLDSVVLSTPLISGYKYRWLLNGSNTLNGADTLNYFVAKSSGNYSVYVLNANGCGTLMKDTNLVFPSSRQQAPTITGITKLCENDTLTLNTSPLTGVTYKWLGPNGFSSSTQNIQRNNVSSLMSGLYSIYVIRNGATSLCDTSITTQVSITINAKPTIQSLTINGSLNLCNGDSVTLSVTSNAGSHYKWFINGNSNSNPQDTFNSLSVKSSGLYSLKVTNANNCSNIMRDTNVFVTTKQIAPSIIGNTIICESDSLKLNASTLSGVSYLWNGPTGFSATAAAIQRNNVDSTFSGIYKVIAIRIGATSKCDTSNTSQVTVTINKKPLVSPISLLGNSQFCDGDSAILAATNQSGIQYRWYKNGTPTTIVFDTNSNLIVKTTGVYTVKKTNLNGCSAIMPTQTINAFTKPVTASIVGNSTVLISSIQNYQVTNSVGSTYSWIIINGTQQTGGNSNQISVLWSNTAGAGSLRLVEVSINGCRGDTITKSINISSTVPDSLSLSKDTIRFSSTADSGFVFLKSNKNWSINNSASWLSITPLVGTTDDTIRIKAIANTGILRSTTINANAGSLTRTLIVIQEPLIIIDSFNIIEDTIFFEALGGIDSIHILSNRSWNVTDTSAWLNTIPSSGTGNTTVTLLVTSNPMASDRLTYVNGVGGTKQKRCVIFQKGISSGLVEELPNQNILIYPNPTHGMLNIEQFKNVPFEILVIDHTGRMLTSPLMYHQQNIQLDYSWLKAGIYFIKITSSEGTSFKQFQKSE